MAEVRISKLIAPHFYDLHLDIKNRKHGEYWLRGGRGSTKSSFVALEIILGMMRTPGANAIVYRKVAATLRESVYEQLTAAIDWLGVREWFAFRVSPMEIRYKPTGQRIIFRGADDPGKSKSIKLSRGYFGFLWFEELSEFQGMEAIRTIRASVIRGTPPGEHALTFCSYNPPISAQNWVNKEAAGHVEGRLVHESCYLDVPKEWLGEAFIAEAEALKKSNERAYRHMYLGEITGTGGNVFENLEIRRIAEEEIQSFGMFYQGIDWGYFPDPFHWVRMSYTPARRTLYILDEYRTVKTGNAAVYAAIRDKLSPDETLIADSAEKKSIADFREYGAWWIHGAVKGAGSVDYSMKWLAALDKIVIDPERCPKAAEEFSLYEYERNAQNEYVNGFPDRDNHAIDAVRYALSLIWRRKGE